MDYKDKYKKYVDNIEPRDDFEKLCKEMELKDNMKNNKKFMKYGLTFLASAVVIGGVVIGVTQLNKKDNKNEDPNKIVTLSLDSDNLLNNNISKLANTNESKSSVSLTVNADNKVVSVYGNDQLAKLVIVDEDLVGSNINDALKTIVDVEVNTGLIVKGNISASNNALEISVSAELSEEAQKYVNDLEKTIKDKLESLDIKANVEVVKDMALTEIKKEVKRIDPKADVEKMTYEEMLKVISIHHIEMSSLYSAQLEELYIDAKDYKIEFAEKEITKEVVNNLDETYVALKNAYSKAVDSLDDAIVALNNAKYDAIMAPDSNFQKAYKELNNKLNDLIIAKNTIDIDDTQAVIEYKVKKAAFETAITGMDLAKDGVDVLCKAAETVLVAAKNALETIEASLPSSIKDSVNEQLKKEETKLNELKDAAFNDFEKEHKEDITKLKNDLVAQKNQLIEAIKNA